MAVLIECVPKALAAEITAAVKVPVIGIPFISALLAVAVSHIAHQLAVFQPGTNGTGNGGDRCDKPGELQIIPYVDVVADTGFGTIQ